MTTSSPKYGSLEDAVFPNTIIPKDFLVTKFDVKYEYTAQEIAWCFRFTAEEASVKLGIGQSKLRVLTRKHGIKRWGNSVVSIRNK